MSYYWDSKFGLTVLKHLVLLEAKSYSWVVFSRTAHRSMFGSWRTSGFRIVSQARSCPLSCLPQHLRVSPCNGCTSGLCEWRHCWRLWDFWGHRSGILRFGRVRQAPDVFLWWHWLSVDQRRLSSGFYLNSLDILSVESAEMTWKDWP